MSRMRVRERFAVTVRGFGILKKYCPGLVRDKALYELITLCSLLFPSGFPQGSSMRLYWGGEWRSWLHMLPV